MQSRLLGLGILLAASALGGCGGADAGDDSANLEQHGKRVADLEALAGRYQARQENGILAGYLDLEIGPETGSRLRPLSFKLEMTRAAMGYKIGSVDGTAYLNTETGLASFEATNLEGMSGQLCILEFRFAEGHVDIEQESGTSCEPSGYVGFSGSFDQIPELPSVNSSYSVVIDRVNSRRVLHVGHTQMDGFYFKLGTVTRSRAVQDWEGALDGFATRGQDGVTATYEDASGDCTLDFLFEEASTTWPGTSSVLITQDGSCGNRALEGEIPVDGKVTPGTYYNPDIELGGMRTGVVTPDSMSVSFGDFGGDIDYDIGLTATRIGDHAYIRTFEQAYVGSGEDYCDLDLQFGQGQDGQDVRVSASSTCSQAVLNLIDGTFLRGLRPSRTGRTQRGGGGG